MKPKKKPKMKKNIYKIKITQKSAYLKSETMFNPAQN